jgi:hypothetical protein
MPVRSTADSSLKPMAALVSQTKEIAANGAFSQQGN